MAGRYQGDRRARGLNCWTQLVALVYAQAAQRFSPRDLEKDRPLLDGATDVFDRAYNDYGWYWRLTQRNIAFVARMK